MATTDNYGNSIYASDPPDGVGPFGDLVEVTIAHPSGYVERQTRPRGTWQAIIQAMVDQGLL